MSKLFVLDTNVLLHDPKAIYRFHEHDVILPIYVIEEVDHFKRDMTELGRNARTISRLIDGLREEAKTNLQDGVKLPTGGTLRVSAPTDSLMNGASASSMDSKIIKVALLEKKAHPDKQTVVVSLDMNLRIRADALGLQAETYDGSERPSTESLYTGFQTLTADAETVDQLGKRQAVELFDVNLYPNACVMLVDEGNPKHTALGRYDAAQELVVALRVPREGATGITPRNVEQTFALDLLLNNDIKLVTLCGRAGTGKTLLAAAAGLRKVITEGAHSRLLVSRPVYPLGRDIGYLPGTLEEKLNPWMQPIFDNLEYIFANGGRALDTGRSYEELVAAGTVQIEVLTYIRGRSLPNQYMIVDEAQNLSPHETKTIITRCGEGTKIVLTGDPEQIDNPYVDAASNGLSTVAERFKDERIAGHVTLTKGERSDLAERASQLL